MKQNFTLCVIEGPYPGPTGTSTLVGIYPTIREVEFIKSVLLERAPNLTFNTIPTDFPPTTKSVGHFLSRKRTEYETKSNKENKEVKETKNDQTTNISSNDGATA